MPNMAMIMRDEILRLARKEVRDETENLKKAVAKSRKEVVALKRRVESLEKLGQRVAKRVPKIAPASPGEDGVKYRFSPKGLAKMRERLSISAADFGRLVGASGPTIYAWENGKTRPRPTNLAAIAAVRQLGKREIRARLTSGEDAVTSEI